jgi:hypothetical protein
MPTHTQATIVDDVKRVKYKCPHCDKVHDLEEVVKNDLPPFDRYMLRLQIKAGEWEVPQQILDQGYTRDEVIAAMKRGLDMKEH